MRELDFGYEMDQVRQAVAAAPLRSFAVPHIVVDDIFSPSLVERINENWPAYDHGFSPEVRGNHVFLVRRENLDKMAAARRRFWLKFKRKLWPVVVAATSEALSGPLTEVFGERYSLSLHGGLNLMQADPTYPGHDKHMHFYHSPHWAFTMLLYVDPDDVLSRGTGIHQLRPVSGDGDTSYRTDDLDWRVDVAMDSLNWIDGQKPDRLYDNRVVEYKAGRLFVFLDGPLALHSVPFDNPDRRPNPERASDGGRHARRRILRSHIAVAERPFFSKHAAALGKPLDPRVFVRAMAPNAVLSPEDQEYREHVLRPFYHERLQAYGRAAEAGQRPLKTDRMRPFGEGFYRPPRLSLRDLKEEFLSWP